MRMFKGMFFCLLICVALALQASNSFAESNPLEVAGGPYLGISRLSKTIKVCSSGLGCTSNDVETGLTYLGFHVNLKFLGFSFFGGIPSDGMVRGTGKSPALMDIKDGRTALGAELQFTIYSSNSFNLNTGLQMTRYAFNRVSEFDDNGNSTVLTNTPSTDAHGCYRYSEEALTLDDKNMWLIGSYTYDNIMPYAGISYSDIGMNIVDGRKAFKSQTGFILGTDIFPNEKYHVNIGANILDRKHTSYMATLVFNVGR